MTRESGPYQVVKNDSILDLGSRATQPISLLLFLLFQLVVPVFYVRLVPLFSRQELEMLVGADAIRPETFKSESPGFLHPVITVNNTVATGSNLGHYHRSGNIYRFNVVFFPLR